MSAERNYIDMAENMDLDLPQLSDLLFYKSLGDKYREAEEEITSQGRARSLPEYIYFEYYVNKRSVNSLAEEFDVARNNLTYLMERLGLPRRTLKEAMSGSNNPMFGKKGPDHPWFGQKHTKESLKIMDQKSRAYWAKKKKS